MKPLRKPFCLCLLALMMIGAGPATSAHGKPGDDEEEKPKPPHGVMLGEFFVRQARQAEGAKVRISFTLYAEVDQEHEDLLQKYVQVHRRRINDQVIVAVRLAKVSDFKEPDLKRLRRLIQMRLSRTGMPKHVRALMITEYEYFTE